MRDAVNYIMLKLVCFFMGHGEFKMCWKEIGLGVSEGHYRCEYCGGKQ